MGYPETDWSAKFLAANEPGSDDDESEPPRTQGTKPSVHPVHFAGAYVDRLYGDVDAELEDGRLVLRCSDEYVADLEHWHYDTFRAIVAFVERIYMRAQKYAASSPPRET